MVRILAEALGYAWAALLVGRRGLDGSRRQQQSAAARCTENGADDGRREAEEDGRYNVYGGNPRAVVERPRDVSVRESHDEVDDKGAENRVRPRAEHTAHKEKGKHLESSRHQTDRRVENHHEGMDADPRPAVKHQLNNTQHWMLAGPSYKLTLSVRPQCTCLNVWEKRGHRPESE